MTAIKEFTIQLVPREKGSKSCHSGGKACFFFLPASVEPKCGLPLGLPLCFKGKDMFVYQLKEDK